MGYDSWENVGYKVIDKINSFEETLLEIRKDLSDLKTSQASLQMKVWAISLCGVAIATVVGKFLGI